MNLNWSPSPLCQGERIEVRGLTARASQSFNPHPPLSLTKGEGQDNISRARNGTNI